MTFDAADATGPDSSTGSDCCVPAGSRLRLLDGTPARLRAAGPGDAALERHLLTLLPSSARRARFAAAAAADGCALVAEVGPCAERVGAGMARYWIDATGDACECAVVVAPDWTGRGLATHLLRSLIAHARAGGLRTMYALEVDDSAAARRLCTRFGFRAEKLGPGSAVVVHRLDLRLA